MKINPQKKADSIAWNFFFQRNFFVEKIFLKTKNSIFQLGILKIKILILTHKC